MNLCMKHHEQNIEVEQAIVSTEKISMVVIPQTLKWLEDEVLRLKNHWLLRRNGNHTKWRLGGKKSMLVLWMD